MLSLAFSHSPSRSYERLGHRIQQAIASPHVQKMNRPWFRRHLQAS
nr:DUF1654 domain-containing protein [Pseudomonas putida]